MDLNYNLIFCDGACSGNPGRGGWGAIVSKQGQVWELGGSKFKTTNNEMEMTAALKALSSPQLDPDLPIIIYTDSTYLIRGITQWIWGWSRNGWTTAEGNEVSNLLLWKKLFSVVTDLQKSSSAGKIQWRYARGHTGIAGNERCDEIAVAFSSRKPVGLYEGSLLGYDVSLFPLPPDEPLPEMRPKNKEKKVAHSYLSLIGSKVIRHADWASCERRVKGQSGAKFKKAMSVEDEQKILQEWGQSKIHEE